MKNRELLNNLFESCKDGRSIAQLHSQIIKLGYKNDSFFATKLISLYAKHSSLLSARKLFDEIPQRTVYLWNATLRSHCKENQWEETLRLFHHMLSGSTTEKPDKFTLSIVLKACAGLMDIRTGKTIHGLVKKNREIGLDMFVGSALVELYAKYGEMGDALRVFQEFPQPDVVLWTSIVTGYQRSDNGVGALSFFTRMMMVERLCPEPVTLVSVLSACAQLGMLKAGRCVHGFMIRREFGFNLSLVNSLLSLYSKTGSIDSARTLFRTMHEKDVISWSSMIVCYVQNDKAAEALSVFNDMLQTKTEPNSATVVSTLQACAAAGDLGVGRKIHYMAKGKGFELDTPVSTALIDMYMKCSCIEEALDLFNRMPHKDVVTWSALINGYAQNGLSDKSLEVFLSMLSHGIRPDAVIVVKILMACAQVGILQQAFCLHGYLVSSGFDNNVFVGAALIDLYSKCGSLDNSITVFHGMSGRDVVVWSSMIAGYGINGRGKKAIKMFNRMIDTSVVKPNSITFLSVLSACSHTGLVDEGIKVFHRMVHEYHIEPTSEHYGILVDLLGRTGKLEKAMDLVTRMPIPPGPHVWGALLGACRIHHNVKMGEAVAEKLLQLDPEHAGYYMLLSNIYFEDGKWDNAAKLRTLAKTKGLTRIPGHSSIEVGSWVHSFLVADSSHPESEQIYLSLKNLEVKMREEGHVPDSSFLLQDVGVSV